VVAPAAPDAETALAEVRNELHTALRRFDETAIESAIDRVLAGFGLDTAIRELFEETSIKSVELIAEAPGWVHYDLPDDELGIAL
jgi:8-oxo-dGTP pyrophosphatase MutT (NUDIX family)